MIGQGLEIDILPGPANPVGIARGEQAVGVSPSFSELALQALSMAFGFAAQVSGRNHLVRSPVRLEVNEMVDTQMLSFVAAWHSPPLSGITDLPDLSYRSLKKIGSASFRERVCQYV